MLSATSQTESDEHLPLSIRIAGPTFDFAPRAVPSPPRTRHPLAAYSLLRGRTPTRSLKSSRRSRWTTLGPVPRTDVSPRACPGRGVRHPRGPAGSQLFCPLAPSLRTPRLRDSSHKTLPQTSQDALSRSLSQRGVHAPP